jgi:5-oxoprolinase (ATP-hydrolysing)
MAKTAAEAGFNKVIGFDMGGTSTDVSHFAGSYERTNETMVAGARVRRRCWNPHGGGGRRVGLPLRRCAFPSGAGFAGAVPGPACYRRGGPLTITDCNVVLRKIRAEHFPAVCRAEGDEPIDADASQSLCAEIGEQAGFPRV